MDDQIEKAIDEINSQAMWSNGSLAQSLRELAQRVLEIAAQRCASIDGPYNHMPNYCAKAVRSLADGPKGEQR